MTKKIHDKPDHWSAIVGMPDAWDKENLTNLINKFKRRKFSFEAADGTIKVVTGKQWITSEVVDARKSHQTSGVGEITNPYGLKVKDSDMRIGTAIPKDLWLEIEEAYPTIFRDKKHMTWFLKNFPEFRVASKV